MALEELKLTLNPDSATPREYVVSQLQTVDISSNKDAFSIAPPGLSSSENILLGVSGMQADINIQFSAHDDGTDKSNGTAPTSAVVGVDASGSDITYTFDGTVVTVEEQLLYLEHVMQSEDFGAQWELDHTTGSSFNGEQVFFEQVDTPVISQASPKWKEATIRLRRGGST
jgi:hypothetical protein